ncbi:MAG: hypothetical protein EOP18_02130 [Rhizobiaceae bacterium]|nr:MAG: hypothetical protein EOP18_02130 [Rhizobiaceae bacterium]
MQLYIQAETTQDRALMIRSLHYLDLAVEAYRHAFGKDDPEVAYALTSYADVERKLNPENPSFSADEAYSEAYRINRARYGPRAIITLAGLVRIGELRSLPSRSRGDPAKIEAARAMLLEAFNGATRGSGWNAEDVRNDADAALRKLDGPDARQRELH